MESRVCRVGLVAFILLCVLAPLGVLAAGQKVIWPSYHGDMLRRGISPSRDIDWNINTTSSSAPGNPASINLIWTFPRAVGEVNEDELYKLVADNKSSLFAASGNFDEYWNKDAWAQTGPVNGSTGIIEIPKRIHSIDCYSYCQADAIPTFDDNRKPNSLQSRARWTFPSDIPDGLYQIWIWVPIAEDSSYNFTKKAVYTVYDDNQAGASFTFDQSNGGMWQLLSIKPFSFTKRSLPLRVELTDLTGDTAAEIAAGNVKVAADAIKFVPTTGQEIYSSPTSAMIPDFRCESSWDDAGVSRTVHWTGNVPVVYTGTIEQPFSKLTGAPDSGRVYCINSVTPDNKVFDSKANVTTMSTTDRDAYEVHKALAAQLGTPIWQYPRNFEAMNPTQVQTFLDAAKGDSRLECEGPIEDGIFSSPTLATIQKSATEKAMVCLVAARDRQFYALDATSSETETTPRLLFKGPGVTVSEDNSLSTVWKQEPALDTLKLRNDAFGGRFMYAKCNNSQTASMTWNFNRAGTGDSSSGEGWNYAVYVWMPAIRPGDPTYRRAKDAEYMVSYDGGSTKVHVDLSGINRDPSTPGNQGRWVKLGSYFNVNSLTLINEIAPPGDGLSESDYCVVADAAMIVPDTIGSFGYCTPALNVMRPIGGNYDGTELASKAYMSTSVDGRIIGVDIQASLSNSKKTSINAKVDWVFPKIRTKKVIDDPHTEADEQSLGNIGASPTYLQYFDSGARERVYLPTLSGRIYGLDLSTNPPEPVKVDIDGTKYPYFFDPQKDPVTGLTPGFTSSINVGLSGIKSGDIDETPPTLFVGSVSGNFYKLDPGLSSVTKLAKPVGAFRYSTPATAKISDNKFSVIAPSANNSIYAFDSTDLSTPIGYKTPDTGSVIQASPALDGYNTLYVGDMSGNLHWYNARTGTSDWMYTDPITGDINNYTGWQCQGALFSSPNITQFSSSGTGTITTSLGSATYIYQGCGDGRIYAFSNANGAWGGEWAGGFWPFQTKQGRENNSIVKRAPSTEVQVDIFVRPFYDKTVSSIAEPRRDDNGKSVLVKTKEDGTPWDPDWIVSEIMKCPDDHSSWEASGLNARQHDRAIDTYLRNQARKQRDALSGTAIFPSTAERKAKEPIYFEWGESFNIIVWNLPPVEFMSGNVSYKLVNTGNGSGAGTETGWTQIAGNPKEYSVLDKDAPDGIGFKPLQYIRGRNTDVKRSYVVGSITLDLKRGMNPGTGWKLYIQYRHRRTNDSSEPMITEEVPIAELENTPTMPRIVGNEFIAQAMGVNNPISIMDDLNEATKIYSPSSLIPCTSIGWPKTNDWQIDSNFRKWDERHYNGNAYGDGTQTKLPLIDLQYVNHGSASREAKLWIADASAYGIYMAGKTLDKFRVDNGELIWNGGINAIARAGSVWLPWEYGSGSADYPNIYKSREMFRKASDDDMPTDRPTSLPTIKQGPIAGQYVGSYIQAETVYSSVDVPRFQPANSAPRSSALDVISLSNDYNNAGYSRLMTAYLDSYPIGGNNQFDIGDVTNSKPQTGQDVFRRFYMGVMIPADPKVEVEEQMVDVGIAPHGLGDNMPEFSAYSLDPLVAQWFKPITIKNAGNVNLWNMRIGRFPDTTKNDAGTNFYVDQEGSIPPIAGPQITSSLDYSAGSPILQNLGTPGLGYTLTKARVGDTDPSIMTIPDKRKWDMNFNNVRTNAQTLYSAYARAIGLDNATLDNPLPVKVSMRVPLTQPVGTYQSYDPYYNVPYVSVFSDRYNNGIVDIVPDITQSDSVAQKSFQMKVSVREAQATGGVTPISLPHIDSADPQYKFGDATPAAYRDPNTGNVTLVWSNNRTLPTPAPTGDALAKVMADAPWLLSYTTLQKNGSAFRPISYSTGNYWWDTPAEVGMGFAEKCWPADLIGAYSGWTKLPWAADSSILSVRHSSPVFAPYDSGGTYGAQIAWVGTADVKDSNGTNKVAQEHRIFYMDQAALGSTDTTPLWIGHDPTQVKRYPSMAVDLDPGSNPVTGKVWMLWQGGDEGRWGLYCSTNSFSNIDSATSINTWTKDMKLLVPDCLTSVSAPNALLRRLWGGNTGLMDVVYAGNTKLGQTSDIMLTRYAPVDGTDPGLASAMPSNFAQPLPRVFEEKLERDTTYGFYAAQHLAWIRPGKGDNLTPDNWGGYAVGGVNPDLPYIRVFIPAGYKLPDNTVTSSQLAISGTDGSVWRRAADTDPWVISVAPLAGIKREVDEATGVYAYHYPAGSVAQSVLGDMLVDYSAGIVRFTKMLGEQKLPNSDRFISAGVYADYTPRTWRLTTDKAADSSPRAFIEKTNMYYNISNSSQRPNPGLGSDWRTSGPPTGNQPVDRMWVFWRKAAAGAQSSTIYYSTYRVGVELSDLFKRNGMVMTPGAKYEITGVENAIGPWEIDKSGTKVYFTQGDERYRSLVNCGSSAIYGGMPGPIRITVTTNGRDPQDLDARDVFWIPELRGQSLLGFSADGNINEGSIYAFADPFTGTFTPAYSSKIWLFWTSTRGGTSDLFWETLSPDFAAR